MKEEIDELSISQRTGTDIFLETARNGEEYRRAYTTKPWKSDYEIYEQPSPEPEPTGDRYLTFTANEDNSSVAFAYNVFGMEPIDINMEYRLGNDGEWQEYIINQQGSGEEVAISLNEGESVQFRGINPDGISKVHGKGQFTVYFCTFNGSISASGDITSILNGVGGDVALTDYCYSFMFQNCDLLTTAPELPSTTLAFNCYQEMFEGCASLTTAPDLPSTTMAEGCYNCMFYDCTGLITAPELPAMTLARNCYYGMFGGCTSLTSAPELPATALIESCYSGMFSGCTSLTTAPELPATTLAENCYSSMFTMCESLTTAPELPALNLVEGCYDEMFFGCTSLTQAPELPATTLEQSCYSGMFEECTSLNSITCLATDISALECTSNWMSNVAEQGTFTKSASMNDWTTGVNGIPTGWTVVDYTE